MGFAPFCWHCSCAVASATPTEQRLQDSEKTTHSWCGGAADASATPRSTKLQDRQQTAHSQGIAAVHGCVKQQEEVHSHKLCCIRGQWSRSQ